MAPKHGPAPLPAAHDFEKRLEFETLIADTSASLFAAEPDALDLAVARALERVRVFFDADRCALLSVSADQQVVKIRLISYGEGVAQVSAEVNLKPLFPWSSQKLLVERVPVRVSRTADLPPEADLERPAWDTMSIRSTLTLPIETGPVVSHIVLIQSVSQEREWPDAFVPRLLILGEMLVGALERRDLFAGLRHTEARLASGADLAGLGFYDVDFGEGVVYFDDRFRDICGIPAEWEQGVQPVEFWMAHLHSDDRQRVLDARQQLHDGRLERLSVEYRYLHPVQGVRWIHHIARVEGRNAMGRAVKTFGVVRDITTRKSAEDDLRDLSGRLIQAHEEQRALLARELHDDVTQRLAVLAIDVGRAELIAPSGPQAAVMREVRDGLVRLSEDVHSLAYQLHPSVLEELGLAEALRTECERIGRSGQVDLSAEIDPLPAAVGKDAALCLFRVAQEALSNVVHHAGARTASVALRPRDGGLLLTVRDDGIGFNLESPGKGRSLGLASMHERVQLVGGTLDIESASGRGTAIVAWVPAEGGSR